MTSQDHSYGKIDFVGKVAVFGGVSAILTIGFLIYLFVHGLNYGIDFAGGTEMQVRFAQPTSIEEVRTVFSSLNLKHFELQQFGDASEFTARFQVEEGVSEKETNEHLQAAIQKTKDAINSQFKERQPEIMRVDSVGPQVGAELQRNGFLAVFYCLLVILIYVAMRFDYKYSPGAVICLFHDAVIALGVYVLVGKEVNVPILASVMTLIGFSLNDTIVVFDRIRETEDHYKDRGIRFIINKSINDMLGRTLITSGTTLVSALCLWMFAGGTVSDIAFVLTVGIIVGTYSSIYVAAPLVLLVEWLRGKKVSA